jgi:hypothetical protein
MRNKILAISGLFVFAVIILLPPIIHGYVYPNIGDDTAAHMNIFDRIGFFAPEDDSPIEKIRYGAIYIVGYPLDMASHIFNVDNDALFMWFNYLALLGVGITLFFVFKNLIGLSAGLLALLIPIFTSYSILLLFYSGVIFEIINIGIILPLACYCVIKWVMTKKKRFVIGAICISMLFAVFHSTGIYLPIILAVVFMAFVYFKAELVKGHPTVSRMIGIAGALCCVVLFVLLSPIIRHVFEAQSLPSEGVSGIALLVTSLLHYMSYLLLVVLLVSIALLVSEYKNINTTEKLTVLVFSILAVVMLPAILFGWSPQPYRQGYDFAIFLSLVSVALVGIIIRLGKYRMVTYLLVGLAFGGAVLHIYDWVGGYNSAMEKIDVEAIHYINTLPGDSYSCSDNVDHWIYSRYVEKGYLPTVGEIFVVRNVPMKSKVAFVEEDILDSDKKLLKRFIDGEVEIEVYK